MSFLIFLHILSAMLFIGNIVTAAFWKLKSEFSKDSVHINRAAKNIMIADYVFTLPGIVGLLITGFLLTYDNNYSIVELNWLSVSLLLFVLTGIIWISLLFPLQRKMIRFSQEFAQSRYEKVSKKWDRIGIIAVILPIVILYLMISKPF